MLKTFILCNIFIFGITGIIYPTKKENTKLFEYCYSLEKIISKNSLQTNKNSSKNVNSISKDIARFGISQTRGAFINKMIDQYKLFKKSPLISFVPNKLYCLAGYWIEEINPGKFESILLKKRKEKIDDFRNLKKEVDVYLKDINSDFDNLKKEFDNLF